MTASPHRATARQRLLLASDDAEQSSELAEILGRVGDVETVPTADLPDDPMGRLSGVVVDINLRSPGSRPSSWCKFGYGQSTTSVRRPVLIC